MKTREALLLIVVLIFIGCGKKNSTSPENESGNRIETWLTTGDQSFRLKRIDDLTFQSGPVRSSVEIEVSAEQHFQTIEGFGAALTNSSAWLLFHSQLRDSMMAALFSRDSGIGISYVRLPMGASDFSSQPAYTYDDVPEGETDPGLDYFSIDADRAFIIPLIKQALTINPDLKIMASPWSAPAWMKTTRRLNGGALQSVNYPVLAQYFVKFIQAYESEGISIDAITVQNEPLYTTADYPSMGMNASAQADFIKNHLGPALEENSLSTKILVWDHNWDNTEYALSVLNDPDVRKYVAGSAWHCYAGNCQAQLVVHDAYPDKAIYFTECSGGAWDSDFASVLRWDIENLFIGSVVNWAKTVLLWNLALDENYGPRIGGCPNCRGVLTVESGGFQKNPEFDIIGHFSRFVRPGAVRIQSESHTMQCVTFQNPDESVVLVVLNATSGSVSFSVKWQGKTFVFLNLPGSSVVTFKWQG
jgi:glucosylceramidase